nr:hypothetical protein [Defluviimonas salinarum]
MEAALDAPLTDLGGDHRPKQDPPEPDGIVADLDAAIVTQASDVPKGERRRMYITTARHVIEGLVLKWRKGLGLNMSIRQTGQLPA